VAQAAGPGETRRAAAGQAVTDRAPAPGDRPQPPGTSLVRRESRKGYPCPRSCDNGARRVSAFLSQRAAAIPDRARHLKVILRLLCASPREPRRVLDLGAGDGILLATVLDAFPEATSAAVDYTGAIRFPPISSPGQAACNHVQLLTEWAKLH